MRHPPPLSDDEKQKVDLLRRLKTGIDSIETQRRQPDSWETEWILIAINAIGVSDAAGAAHAIAALLLPIGMRPDPASEHPRIAPSGRSIEELRWLLKKIGNWPIDADWKAVD